MIFFLTASTCFFYAKKLGLLIATYKNAFITLKNGSLWMWGTASNFGPIKTALAVHALKILNYWPDRPKYFLCGRFLQRWQNVVNLKIWVSAVLGDYCSICTNETFSFWTRFVLIFVVDLRAILTALKHFGTLSKPWVIGIFFRKYVAALA